MFASNGEITPPCGVPRSLAMGVPSSAWAGALSQRSMYSNIHGLSVCFRTRVKDYAALRLLALRNDAWSDEGEPPLESDEFKDRMRLESITVHPDGDFEYWYNDGDLFWGHAIHVSGSLAAGPTGADTPG